MANWAKIGKGAFNAFEKVNSVVAFYMFIIEESIQTVGMGVYLSNKAGNMEKMKELAQWNKTELIKPLKDFCDGVGYLGVPMNFAFKKFAEASEKAMDYYISISETKPPAPTTGGLYVDTSPEKAKIYLDGKDTETLTPQTFSDLDPKTYTVKFVKDGYEDKEISVTVEAGKTKEYFVELTATPPPPPTTGDVYIASSPPNAQIFLDGKDTETLTPQTLYNLSTGQHQIKLVKSGYADEYLYIDIEAGIKKEYFATMTKL